MVVEVAVEERRGAWRWWLGMVVERVREREREREGWNGGLLVVKLQGI
jgi:hypothetical protein